MKSRDCAYIYTHTDGLSMSFLCYPIIIDTKIKKEERVHSEIFRGETIDQYINTEVNRFNILSQRQNRETNIIQKN